MAPFFEIYFAKGDKQISPERLRLGKKQKNNYFSERDEKEQCGVLSLSK